MNIFYLDKDPKKAARYHITAHCSKLILESGQLLSTAVRINNPNLKNDLIYKPAYVKHPCTIAVFSSRKIFRYVVNLGINLNLERKYRYNYDFDHKTINTILECEKYINTIPDEDYPWPLAMPDECRCDDPVLSYRNYYIKHKRMNKNGSWMMYYTPREIPEWMPDNLRKAIEYHQELKEAIF